MSRTKTSLERVSLTDASPHWNPAGTVLSGDALICGAAHTINDAIADTNVNFINLGTFNPSITVSKNLTIEEVLSDNNSSLVFNITDSATLTLGKAGAVIQNNNQLNMPSDFSSLTQITLEPGATFSSMGDATFFGHLMTGGQSFTNASDINTELVFNDNTNVFILQPIGEVVDLG